jgi:hypothetical protein
LRMPTSGESSVFRCQCGAKLKIPATAAGKRLKCPKCGFRFEVPAEGVAAMQRSTSVAPPAPKPAKVAAPKPAKTAAPRPDTTDTGDSLLNDLMGMEQSAATTETSSVLEHQKTCPKCKAAMAKDMMICLSCGHDLAAPVKAKAAKAATKAASAGSGGLFGRMARSGGRLALGTALSAVGALIGAAIWFGVAMAVELEIGYVALAVGFLAGFGMMLGYNKQNTLGGLVAAGMSLMGIVMAKILIFAFLLFSAMANDPATASDPAAADHAAADNDAVPTFNFDHFVIASHRSTRRADEEGLSPWSEKRGEYLEEERSKIAEMEEQEVEAALAEIEQWEDAKWSDPAYVRTYLIYHYASELDTDADAAAEEQADFDEDAYYDNASMEARWNGWFAQASTKVDNMSAEEQRVEAERIRAEEKDFGAAEVGLGLIALLVVFILATFGFFDLIFVIIAMVTAYKLASGWSEVA